MVQVGAALVFLHSRSVIHCDLKTDNVLIQTRAPASTGSRFGDRPSYVPFHESFWDVRLGDFGRARQVPGAKAPPPRPCHPSESSSRIWIIVLLLALILLLPRLSSITRGFDESPLRLSPRSARTGVKALHTYGERGAGGRARRSEARHRRRARGGLQATRKSHM